MNKLNLLLLCICFFNISFAQNKEVSGIVFSSETNLPIEFINVGVVNSTVGTITDSNGIFKLSIPKELLDNEIKIKSIEYETKIFKISQLTQIENKKIEENKNKISKQFEEKIQDNIKVAVKVFNENGIELITCKYCKCVKELLLFKTKFIWLLFS